MNLSDQLINQILGYLSSATEVRLINAIQSEIQAQQPKPEQPKPKKDEKKKI